MIRINKKSGFSLVEVVVASVIFIIGTVGLFSTLGSLRTTSNESQKRLFAANCGKQILERLRAQVDDRTWVSGSGGGLDPSIPHTEQCTDPNNVTYTATYTVTAVNDPVSGKEIGRQVDLNVNWPL